MPIAKLSNLCLSPLKLARLGLRMDWIANSLFSLVLMISPTIGARGYPFAAGHVLFVSSQALLIFDPWWLTGLMLARPKRLLKVTVIRGATLVVLVFQHLRALPSIQRFIVKDVEWDMFLIRVYPFGICQVAPGWSSLRLFLWFAKF